MRSDGALLMLVPSAASRSIRVMGRWFAQRLALTPRGLDSLIEEELELVFLEGVRFGRNFHARPTRVRFSVPIYRPINAEGDDDMPANITLPRDQEVMVPLTFSDAIGQVNAPVAGGSVTVDNEEVVTASLENNDQAVVVVAVADGQTTVHYENSSVTPPIFADLVVTVIDPVPTQVSFNVSAAQFGPIPAPPTSSGTSSGTSGGVVSGGSSTSSGGDVTSGGNVTSGGTTTISGTISGTVSSSTDTSSSTDSGTTVSGSEQPLRRGE